MITIDDPTEGWSRSKYNLKSLLLEGNYNWFGLGKITKWFQALPSLTAYMEPHSTKFPKTPIPILLSK